MLRIKTNSNSVQSFLPFKEVIVFLNSTSDFGDCDVVTNFTKYVSHTILLYLWHTVFRLYLNTIKMH